MTLDQARARLEAWVRTTRWLRRGAANALNVTSFRAVGAQHVSYEKFYETRGVSDAARPYAGGPVDGPEHGDPPDPWRVEVPDGPLFVAVTHAVPLPHTARVATCDGCTGRGRVSCGDCGGNGRVSCPDCNRTGRCTCSACNGGGRSSCGACGRSGSVSRTEAVTTTDANGNTATNYETRSDPCGSCGGAGSTPCGSCGAMGTISCARCGTAGTIVCTRCGGGGDVTCDACAGHGRLEHYRLLTVARSHRVFTRTLDGASLPDELVHDAPGALVHEEEDVAVPPDGRAVRVRDDVDTAARLLVASNPLPQGARCLRERLRVTSVPVHVGEYTWGGRARRFYVYGFDARVHAPDFPRSPLRIGAAVLAVVALVLGAVALVAAAVSS